MATESPIDHPADWPVTRLGDIAFKIGSGATPRGGADNYLASRTNFALIRSQNVFDRHFDSAGLVFISDEQANELRNVVLQPGDLLLNITGDGVTFARCCAVPEEILPACVNQHVSIVRINPNCAHPGYVLSYLTHPLVKEYIEAFNAGGSRRAITKGHIESFMLPLPPLDEQRAIANMLGNLDDKIELNRKMNDTLEAIARALFKSWFVGFDPVRAKAEGRDTGLPPHIAALFPDSFEDSQLGNIPAGWTVKSLDQIGQFLNGLALQKFPPIGERSLPVIKISQLRSGNTIGADRASADLEPAYIVRDGDILFSWSGSLECVFWAGGPGALNQHLFKVTSIDFPQWLLYFAIHLHLADFRHIAAGKATTMGHIQRHHLSEAKLAVPPASLLREMTTIIEPIVESTWRRNVQSRTLAAIRDAILPKLISGELRLSDSGSAIERG